MPELELSGSLKLPAFSGTARQSVRWQTADLHAFCGGEILSQGTCQIPSLRPSSLRSQRLSRQSSAAYVDLHKTPRSTVSLLQSSTAAAGFPSTTACLCMDSVEWVLNKGKRPPLSQAFNTGWSRRLLPWDLASLAVERYAAASLQKVQEAIRVPRCAMTLPLQEQRSG